MYFQLQIMEGNQREIQPVNYPEQHATVTNEPVAVTIQDCYPAYRLQRQYIPYQAIMY
jgi:hypothetical protein